MGDETAAEPDAARHAIVDAAAKLFASAGLAATLAQVAQASGVGVGSVYRRFASKDDLILQVYADRFAAVEEVAQRASAAEDAWEGVVTLFEDSVLRVAADRGFREFVLGTYRQALGWSRGAGPQRVEALVARSRDAVQASAARLVQRAQDAGELRADVDAGDMFLLVMAVQSTLEGPDPEAWRRVAAIVLDGLRVSPRQPPPLTG